MKPDEYLNKVKEKEDINKIMKRGTGTTAIKDFGSKSDIDIKNAVKRALKDLIDDEEIADIMSQEENLQKIKNRIEIKIFAKGIEGESLYDANIFSTTPKRARDSLNEIAKGTNTHLDYHADKLKEAGWLNYNEVQEGILERFDAQINIRRG